MGTRYDASKPPPSAAKPKERLPDGPLLNGERLDPLASKSE